MNVFLCRLLTAEKKTIRPTGFEHPALEPPKTAISGSSGAKSDAHDAPKPIQDPTLAKIIDAWPELPEHIKAAIKALVETVGKSNKERRT
jgi:hypothetical protein